MCRGNRREGIFRNDGDRLVFLKTLAEVCERTGWKLCAYVLMPNHYHLVLETPEANLIAGMRWFQGTYTKRYNARNGEWGHLFQGRYKSVVIDPEEPGYFRTACDYVHLNPARAHLTDGDGRIGFREYAWSSSWYLSRSEEDDPFWLKLSRIVQEHVLRQSDRNARNEYLRYLETRALEERGRTDELEATDEYRHLRRGWCFGSDEFKSGLQDDLDACLNKLNRDSITGEPRRMHDESEARRLLSEACLVVGLDLEEKERLKKNDFRKAAVAWFLRKKIPMGLTWIAGQLGMGSRANVSRAVRNVADKDDGVVRNWKTKLDEMYRCAH
jgi:REP element-mobilizing transposase RayT